MNREKCPCCGYPTMDTRGNYEICLLCNWEDDGQDSDQATEVWGGPNGDYSLEEARNNFKKNLVMYRNHTDNKSQEKIKLKKMLMKAYEKLDVEQGMNNSGKWTDILIFEKKVWTFI